VIVTGPSPREIKTKLETITITARPSALRCSPAVDLKQGAFLLSIILYHRIGSNLNTTEEYLGTNQQSVFLSPTNIIHTSSTIPTFAPSP